MLKVEKVQSFLNCSICTERLEKPIFLPCGQIICNKHLDEMEEKSSQENLPYNSAKKRIQCFFCSSEHYEHFQVALSIQKMLEMNFDQIHSTKFKVCKSSVNELKEELIISENVLNDPENFIYEYFASIKNQVNVQREVGKERIDFYCEKVLEEITVAEDTCKEIAQEHLETLSTELNELKAELNHLMEEFDSNEISEAKYEDIVKKTLILKPKFSSLAERLDKNIFNGKSYEFNAADLKIKDIFGKFIVCRVSSLI